MKWRIGKGDQVKFWKDKWITDEALIHYTGDPQVIELHCPVSSFFEEDWWDIDKLRSVLGEEIVQKIINTPVDFIGSTPDVQIWKPTANGTFSVKSAYNLSFHPSDLMIVGSSYGASKSLQKCSSLFGLCLELDFQPWLRINLTTNSKWRVETPWTVAFAYTCWYIWKWRNIRVFGKEEDLPFDSRKVILKATQEWSTARSANTKTTGNYQIILAWEPPPPGYLKLNVDGSYKCASGSIGAGGVIREERGNWTGGFAINLGKGQILEAEIWGLFFGQKLAVQKGINNLIVEMDSATAVLLFQNSNILGLHPLATLLSSCWELMHQIDKCVVKHVYREKNMIADCLAKGSFNFDLGLVSFADIPRSVGTHLEEDLMGVHRTRLIAVV
ncbi:unnamed protein product [Prunus armeniaca]